MKKTHKSDSMGDSMGDKALNALAIMAILALIGIAICSTLIAIGEHQEIAEGQQEHVISAGI